MRYLPIGLDVFERDVLVAGATGEIISKIERLLDAGARVTVVAADMDAQVEQWARDGRIRLERRKVCERDLEGKLVVFVAPQDETVARSVYDWAVGTGRLVCTIDRPEMSTFVNPAVVQASDLTISFATGGVSPGVLRRIREDLSALFSDARFGRFLSALRALREALPRGERAERMREAVQEFGIEGRLRFPAWFARDDDPGGKEHPASEKPQSGLGT